MPLRMQLDVMQAKVMHWGTSTRTNVEVKSEFWGDWETFKSAFLEMNNDNGIAEIMTLIRRQISNAEKSVRIAAETLFRKPSELPDFYNVSVRFLRTWPDQKSPVSIKHRFVLFVNFRVT